MKLFEGITSTSSKLKVVRDNCYSAVEAHLWLWGDLRVSCLSLGRYFQLKIRWIYNDIKFQNHRHRQIYRPHHRVSNIYHYKIKHIVSTIIFPVIEQQVPILMEVPTGRSCAGSSMGSSSRTSDELDTSNEQFTLQSNSCTTQSYLESLFTQCYRILFPTSDQFAGVMLSA